MGYDKSIKLKLVKKFKEGNKSLSQVALKWNIPKQTLARWVKLYNRFGEIGLENRKPGTKEIKIDLGFEKLVLEMWKKKKRSVYMMRKDLRKGSKRNGYNISERQVRKIYKKHSL